MKTKNIHSLENYSGTILIPIIETNVKSIVPIEFNGVSVDSKVFYGKKDTFYLVEKYNCTHVFIGLGKTVDYKSLKTIFRRIASKQKEVFAKNVTFVIPNQFSNDQVEASISGLILGTYNLGHFKKIEKHPFLNDNFELEIFSENDFSEVIIKAIKSEIPIIVTESSTLLFAMNGGMFQQDFSPLGLYVENGIKLKSLNKREGKGNFYLMPNGVFYITNNNIPKICKTKDFKLDSKIKYATQSGPMLVINGSIHSSFIKNSTNLNIRNGVGILPNNHIVFAMSKKEINFYNFANYFKNLGCKNALYLDGFVSRVYCPKEKWIQTDGDFGVIIAVTKENK